MDALCRAERKATFSNARSLLHMLGWCSGQRRFHSVSPRGNLRTITCDAGARFLAREDLEPGGLNLLSIRYGLQTMESIAKTTIGWGLVSEAYANFGYWAVIVVGALFGAICGALMRLSIGAPPNSLPMFTTIAATLVLLNVEADLSYLLTTLAQLLRPS